MKKLIAALLAIAIVCSFAVPVMADEPTSPVKDYATANNGDLLYTVDFSGKDGVMQFDNLGDSEATKYFSYTPSDDGKSLSVQGKVGTGKEKGTFWGGLIPSLKADMTTVYTLTYKVKMNGEAGKNNSIGVGSYFVSCEANTGMRSYNLYGNYSTVGAGGDTSMRRSSLSINSTKQADYVMWSTLPAYEVDADGFVTTMLVYDGTSLTLSAYIRAEGAGDGSKDTDWVKVEDLTYVPGDDCMGFLLYAYYIESVDAVVKDVNIYKGKIYTESTLKDYASVNNGDLVYKFDFSGKDGVLQLGNLGGGETDKYFSFTPSDDGSSLTIKGKEGTDKTEFTGYYGATIPSLKADMTTTYTMTYKVKMNGEYGKNNSIGVGAYFTSGATDSSLSAYHLYGNYGTVGAGGDISMRRTSLSINNVKQADYVMWNTLPAYEIDADGFVTVMLVYEGSSLTLTAYIRAEGAGNGSKESDWVKLESLTYVPGDDCMGLMLYAYYVNSVDAVVKDANLYKGKIFTKDEPVVQPTEKPTTKPTTAPTEAPAETPVENPAQFPWGIVIGIAAAVIVAAVVVVIVLKKKKG